MDILEQVKAYLKETKEFTTDKLDEVEAFRIKFLSKKSGTLVDLFKQFKNIEAKHKKEYGQLLNELKDSVSDKVEFLKQKLTQEKDTNQKIDLSLPYSGVETGSRHPVSLVRDEIIDIFLRLGYNISEGPEIEDDEHVFGRLNFPLNHPARDMQDTFFIEKNPDILLRTHTSSVQVRVMDNAKPPIRTISPGRVFRNEAISARAHCIFHQIEGLYIDENVSFADLKHSLLYFAKEMFDESAQIRLRPSYFPFTEPSAEVDVSCLLCNTKGCNVCKHTGWLEILGCGMVDPNVLESNGIDSNKYSGFAFGMGLERIAMLKYGINDLRHFFENDLRFLRQFK